jgi:hypothetical protein
MNFPRVSVTFSAHHILFDLINRTLYGKEYNFEVAYYAVCSIVARNFREDGMFLRVFSSLLFNGLLFFPQHYS